METIVLIARFAALSCLGDSFGFAYPGHIWKCGGFQWLAG
jgi:hypothetical protein